jgi:sugar phosphate isomerase/epimerase
MHGVNTPFVTADDLLDAIRHFPTLRFTYDNGNCLTGGDDPAVSFTRTAPYVAHVHFKDWIQRASPEGCVGARSGKFFKPELIGEGVIDHRSVLSAMRSAKYSGFIDIEYEGDRYPAAQAVRKAVEYLRTLCPELR